MIRFLLKGLLRDRSRSLLPFLTVILGSMLTVVGFSWINGAISTIIEASANFSAGHVKVMTRAYAAEADQAPNDLAMMGVGPLVEELRRDHPSLLWTPRIKFGGLIDIPDENGETRAQGPAAGLGVDLLTPGSPERKLLNLDQAVVRGRLPERPGEPPSITVQFDLDLNGILQVSALDRGSGKTQGITVTAERRQMNAADKAAAAEHVAGLLAFGRNRQVKRV